MKAPDHALSTCPGCGLVLPASGEVPDAARNRSSECGQVRDEVLGFELAHPRPRTQLHQLMVDAYMAQHASPAIRPIGPAFALAGLYLAFERGLGNDEVRRAHMVMAKQRTGWPVFGFPPARAGVTILDVAEAGVRRASVEGHEGATRAWAAEVWATWAPRHAEIAAMTLAALGW